MVINNSQPSSTAAPQMMFQPPMMMSSANTIKAQVVVKEMYDPGQGDDTWPDAFSFAPQRGDTIQSAGGRRLTVLEVVHKLDNGAPVVLVEIGVDRTTSTPTEGGGGNLL